VTASKPALPPFTLEELVGQVIMAVWPEDEERLAALVARGRIGGVFLRPGQGAGWRQLAAALSTLQRTATYPLLCAADPVAMAGPLSPCELALGAARLPELAQRCGRAAGAQARALGIHLLLAPSLDVHREPGPQACPMRSFGENPSLAGRLGAAFVAGCHAGRALAVAGRFPGRGGAVYDPERALYVLPHDRQTLEKIDLVPYVEACGAGLRAIMSGHLHVVALDNLPNRLATHSSAVVEGLLRRTLRFSGLLLSDNLDAPEVRARYRPGQAAVLALAVGHDLLVTESPEEVYRALYEVVQHGDIPLERLREAAGRVWAAKEWLGLPGERFVDLPPEEVAEVPALASEVARASLTVVWGRPERLAGPGAVVLSSRSRRADGSAVEADVRRLAGNLLTDVSFYALDPDPAPTQLDQVAASAATARAALLFVDAVGAGADWPGLKAMAALAQTCKRVGLPVGVFLLGNPHVLARFCQVDLLAYLPGHEQPYLEAAFSFLLGRSGAPGRLSVTVAGM